MLVGFHVINLEITKDLYMVVASPKVKVIYLIINVKALYRYDID